VGEPVGELDGDMETEGSGVPLLLALAPRDSVDVGVLVILLVTEAVSEVDWVYEPVGDEEREAVGENVGLLEGVSDSLEVPVRV